MFSEDVLYPVIGATVNEIERAEMAETLHFILFFYRWLLWSTSSSFM